MWLNFLGLNRQYRRLKLFSAQILVTTLLMLMIVSMTVVGITYTTLVTTRQVQTSVEYEKSYNYAETRILKMIDYLSDLDLELQMLESQGLDDPDCGACTRNGIDEYVCLCEEDDPDRKTAVAVKEVNYLENYDLGNGEYFDIILSDKTGPSFKGSIKLSWVGSTAFELTLFYEQTNGVKRGELNTQQQILDPTGDIYKSVGNGFINPNPVVNGSSVSINLSNVNTKVPTTAKYRYLRVRAVNKEAGTSISIRPSTSSISLPNQVRRIEAINYNIKDKENSAPLVMAQLPLKPPTADPLSYSISALNIIGKNCGNNVLESNESCDDGNLQSNDDCLANCILSRCGDGHWNKNGPARIEQCDDGNISFNDDCVTYSRTDAAICKLNVCGDGYRNIKGTPSKREACDEGDDNGTPCTNLTYGYSGRLLWLMWYPKCRDLIGKPVYGSSCDYCTNACTEASVLGSYCGDGIVQDGSECVAIWSYFNPSSLPREQCDSGDDNTNVPCTPGYNRFNARTCTYCSESCISVRVTGGTCGDNVKNGPEQCDGSNIGCSPGQTCGNDCRCKDQVCGDGKVTGTEVCDTDAQGNTIHRDGWGGKCSDDCLRSKMCSYPGVRECPKGKCDPLLHYEGCGECDYPSGHQFDCGDTCVSCACCRKECYEDINRKKTNRDGDKECTL